MSVPWIPSPAIVVNYLFDMLGVAEGDTVVDLGCGDGRVVIEAAKRGARGVCIEVDRVLCNVTEVWARAEGVENKVSIVCRDFFEVDLRSLDPTIVYAYLYPSTLQELSPRLEALSPGTIIATLDFAIRGWSPVFAKVLLDESGFERVIWLYIVGLSNPSARRAGLSRNIDAFVSRLKHRIIAV